MQPDGNVNCLRTRLGRIVFGWNLGDEMHNSVIISCFTCNLQYCLNDEYNIKDEMQLGYNRIECPDQGVALES